MPKATDTPAHTPIDTPAGKLLRWYDRHARVLPWRAAKGVRADPYRVWLSEIMLQQTTVQAVAGYYRRFLERWPDVQALAAAPLDDVLAAWAGLGYYARARNLHAAAKMVAGPLNGAFPKSVDELRKLPGVGLYTAGAIAAIAFDVRAVAMDANAERVIARYFAVRDPLPKAKAELKRRAETILPDARAGDFAQALMDLGAAICTPKRPDCKNCPWTDGCAGRAEGLQEVLPVKGEKPPRPLKRGAAFVVRDAKGAVLLVRRPEKGLLGGMMQPPLGPWTEDFPGPKEALLQAPFRADWKKHAGVVRHGFTHFELEIEVYVAVVPSPNISPCHSRPSRAMRGEGKGTQASKSGRSSTPGSPSLGSLTQSSPGMTTMFWIEERKLKDAALPTVMRKVIAHGLDEGGPLFSQAKSSGAKSSQARSARKR